MLGLRAQADGVFARAHEIAQRFIIGRRDVDRRELAGAMQPGQGVAVAPIGLDPIAAPFRHARRIDDDAVLPLGGEIAVDPKPARAGLVHEPQPSVRRAAAPARPWPRPPGRPGSRRSAALRRRALPPRARCRSIPCGHPSPRTCYVSPWPASVVCGSARHPHRLRVIHDLLREAGLLLQQPYC